MRGRNSVPGSSLPPDSAERTTSTTEYLNGKDCDCRKAVAVFPASREKKGAIEWMSESNLMRVSYQDAAQEIRLSAYADVVIYEPIGQRKILRAVRLGGYPEMTHGLADAFWRRKSGGSSRRAFPPHRDTGEAVSAAVQSRWRLCGGDPAVFGR